MFSSQLSFDFKFASNSNRCEFVPSKDDTHNSQYCSNEVKKYQATAIQLHWPVAIKT